MHCVYAPGSLIDAQHLRKLYHSWGSPWNDITSLTMCTTNSCACDASIYNYIYIYVHVYNYSYIKGHSHSPCPQKNAHNFSLK